MATNLFNLEYEKQLLSAIIRNHELLAELPHINEKDFSQTNRIVFQAIKSCLDGDKSVNKFTLAAKLNALNVKIGGEIDPEIYINSLELIGVNDKSAIDIAKQIKKWTVRRELHEIGEQIKKATENDTDSKALDLVVNVTKIFNDKINILGGSEDEPKDLYGTISDFLDYASPYDNRSIESPFPIYNDMYGFLDPGNLYCVAARAKIGKSTLVLSMLQQITMVDKNDEFRGLILDTELTIEEVQCRIISSITGIKEFMIRRKIYKKFKDMRDKVDVARELIKPLFKKVNHIFVGGKSLEEQLSIVRRWYAKNIANTNRKCLVCLDYFKLGSTEDFDNKNPMFLTIGKKVDCYKQISKELQIPIFALVQANREAEDSKGGHKVTNGNAIAGSDMISQFCSNIYILQKLSIEEKISLNQLDEGSATHSLISIYNRQLGPDEMGQHRLVKYKNNMGNDRYTENYLLYSFNNFAVKEIGTFRDVIEKNKIAAINVQQSKPADGTDSLL